MAQSARHDTEVCDEVKLLSDWKGCEVRRISIWGVHKTHSRLTGMDTLEESCMSTTMVEGSGVDTVVQRSFCDNVDSTNNQGQVPLSQGGVQMLFHGSSKTEEVMTSEFVSQSIRMNVIDEANEIKKSECAISEWSLVASYSVEASTIPPEEEVEEEWFFFDIGKGDLLAHLVEDRGDFPVR